MPKLNKKKRSPVKLSFLPEQYQKTILAVFDRYKASGLLTDIVSPDDRPTFPSKISSINLSELGDYHTQFEAWLGYTRDKLKYWKVIRTVVADFMDTEYNRAMSELREGKGNIDSKKSEARTDENFLEVKEYFIQVSALEEMMYQESERLSSNVMSLRAALKSREVNDSY